MERVRFKAGFTGKMKALRLALIGCGSHSEEAHAKPLAHFAAQHPGVIELVAACDLDRARAGRFCVEYGFATAYTGIQDMLDLERPDAVVSILPIEKTAEVGSELLRRRIPCVLEKPPGRSLEEVKTLAQLARQTGTPHFVSMNRRYNPYLNRALEWAGQQGGAIRYIQGRMLRHARREEDFLWGTGIHIVDAVCYIGGESVGFAIKRLEPVSSTPWFLITLQFASGCTGHIEIFPTTGLEDEVIEIFGEDFRAGARTMGREGESVRCWRNGVLEVEEMADLGAPLFLRNGSYEETAAFVHSLREGIALRPTLGDVLPALTVCGQNSS
jgi:predicted dehydrogenase